MPIRCGDETRNSKLREQVGRANVLVAHCGGWALHDRLPLALHHVHAALHKHGPFHISELDFVTATGVSTVTDVVPTMDLLRKFIDSEFALDIVTSVPHGSRLIAEGNLHRYSSNIQIIDSKEHVTPELRTAWPERGREVPAYQYARGGRASDVMYNGCGVEGRKFKDQMAKWAKDNPIDYCNYRRSMWELVGNMEEKNVVVHCTSPGGMRLRLNQ